MSNMKPESREEATARMKALSQAERQGVEAATEGQIAVKPTAEQQARAAMIDEAGEKQAALNDELARAQSDADQREADAIDATAGGDAGKSATRAPAKTSAKK